MLNIKYVALVQADACGSSSLLSLPHSSLPREIPQFRLCALGTIQAPAVMNIQDIAQCTCA